jgi:NADP-dependent 3-hydroxy acid dehydrogenase YdfG
MTPDRSNRKPFDALTAVVTGASGDIGAAIALALADLGAAVCIVGRRTEALEALADRAPAAAPPMLVQRADLTLDQDVARLADTVRTKLGRLDVLVHSAGLITSGTHESASLEDFDLQYRANLRAPYALTQVLLPLLKASQGQMVFIGSTAAFSVRPALGQFAATQHAFRAMANTLREELNPASIRILTVYPGRTATQRMARIFAREGRVYQPELLLQPDDIATMVMAALRLPRTAEVTDITMRPMRKSY